MRSLKLRPSFGQASAKLRRSFGHCGKRHRKKLTVLLKSVFYGMGVYEVSHIWDCQCRQARQGVFEAVSDGLIVGICLFLRGPQPVTCVTRVPVFEHFFWSHFLMPFWSQMASHLEPKIAKNPEKSCSSGLPESSLKKVIKNYAIWVPSTPQKSTFRTVGVAKIKK